MSNVKRFRTGDSVIVSGKIPGYEGIDRGLEKRGIVMGIVEAELTEGGSVLGIDVQLESPVPGIDTKILREAAAQGPWCFPPQDVRHDIKKVGRV